MTAKATDRRITPGMLHALVLLLSFLASVPVNGQDAAPGHDHGGGTLGRAVPHEILDPPWLEGRRAAELATREDFDAFIGFTFDDKLPGTGITFRNRVVADAGITYKAVHYDHGNGIAVADVDGDGDGRLDRNRGDGTFEDVTTIMDPPWAAGPGTPRPWT